MQEYKSKKVASCNAYAMQPCNSSSESDSYATSDASVSVKSLANKILSRNLSCNSDATKNTVTVRKIPLELQQLLGGDLAYYRDQPEALESLKQLFNDRQQMRQGIVPDSYCYQAYCDHCGAIPLYAKGRYMGCPWCLLGGYQKVRSGTHEQ